jgi:hypothetical protein
MNREMPHEYRRSLRLNALTPAHPESVTPICVSILWASDAGGFPWSNGFHYDPDSGQHVPDLILQALGFGLQEFLQLLEFGG